MKLTIEQIKSIISGTEESLRLLQSQPEYLEIVNNENFITQNEMTLGDAIQALSEVYQAIIESEYTL
ncbi:MAG: hypothetical protein QQW96_03975 [Tychonema bourrellyi B0820]|nr:hypothetical protein [Tychonema bourrellyi B0820]PJE45203.1 MAG: hypothetical protein CUR32_00975 [Flavobacterium sp.] [Flavobacterium sp. FEMGT703F]